MEDPEGTSLGVHLECLLASGPALALVLHLPMKCGSCTPGLEFRCRIVSREEGCCVSWIPLGVERVACMTAAYLETSSRNLSSEGVSVIALTLRPFGICDGIPLLSTTCRGISLLYKSRIVQGRRACKLGELKRLLVKCINSLLDKA